MFFMVKAFPNMKAPRRQPGQAPETTGARRLETENFKLKTG